MVNQLASTMENPDMFWAPVPVVAFGELLIDFVPTVAGVSLAEAPAFKKAPEGDPAKVAVGVSRGGENAAFIGKVGGHCLLAHILQTDRVNIKGLCFDSEPRTALAFVTLTECGKHEFIFSRNPSADMLMLPPELDESLLRQSSVFHYGSMSLISEVSRATHLAAMKVAQERGALMSYDPNLRLPLWPSPKAARDGILSILDDADIIKVSDEEVKFLTEGGDDKRDEVVMQLWHPKLKLLLVTDGPDGIRYYTPGFRGRIGSLIKTRTVDDTTGVRTVFVAALLHRLTSDEDVLVEETALRSVLKFAYRSALQLAFARGAN